MAPTVIALSALACPTMVGDPIKYSLGSLAFSSPRKITYLKLMSAGLHESHSREITILISVCVSTVKLRISTGSPPRLLRLKPKSGSPLKSFK